jgi:glycosyltransferase involved in cell wall biosynthesis
MSKDEYPIGVVIPTYNRPDALFKCLKHLEQQTFTDFEVVVVDDGSTDSTPQVLSQYQKESPLHLRCFRQENGGPARARNVGIAALRSPLCVIIGDDIFPSISFVANHLQLHQKRPETQVAGLGFTRWDESEQVVTKFMRWLDDSGLQFGYKWLFAGRLPDYQYFYTSNISVKTELLREYPFNEQFKKAAMEDVELGYRINLKHGLEIVFIPDALASHLHPTNVRQGCTRMLTIGRWTHLFYEIWPDARSPEIPRLRRLIRDFTLKNQWLLPPLISISEQLTKVWCPNPLTKYLMRAYYNVGFRSASLAARRATK